MRVDKPLDRMLEEIQLDFPYLLASSYSLIETSQPARACKQLERDIKEHHPGLSYLAPDVSQLVGRAMAREHDNDPSLPVSVKILRGERGYVLRIRSPEPVYACMDRIPSIDGKAPLLRKGLQYSIDPDGCGVNLMKLYERSGLGARVHEASPDVDAEWQMHTGRYAADECYAHDSRRN